VTINLQDLCDLVAERGRSARDLAIAEQDFTESAYRVQLAQEECTKALETVALMRSKEAEAVNALKKALDL
jgi:hypothetical protein